MTIRLNRFRPSAAGPEPGGSLLVQRLVRHLRWSAAISAGFAGPGRIFAWPPATLTFGPGVRHIWRLASNAFRFQLSWSSLQQTPPVTNHFVTHSFARGGGRPPATADTAFRIPGPSRLPLTVRHTILRDTLERHSRICILREPATPAVPPSRTPLAGAISHGKRRGAVAKEETAQELTTRIMHRLRRTEEVPRSPEPMRALGIPAIHERGTMPQESVQVPQRHLSAVRSPANASGSLASPSINITHLTDEVIRQIDQRLVGARERMGRI